MKSAKASRPRIVLTNRAIVINKEGKFLLIQRSPTSGWAPNVWQFPGGKLDEGQDIANALEREVFEETGLLIIPTHRVAYYESVFNTTGKYKGLPYICLTGIARVEGSSQCKMSDEHQAFAWVTLEEAADYEVTQETRKALLALDDLIRTEQK